VPASCGSGGGAGESLLAAKLVIPAADFPDSLFHGQGRNGKLHLQRPLPAEAAALRATLPA